MRLIYIKDNDTGEFYDANRNLSRRDFSDFKCRMGMGYQTVESVYNGIQTTFTITVPQQGLCELYRISVKNDRDSIKNLSAYFYIKLNVNVNGHLAYGRAYYDEKKDLLIYDFNAFREQQKYLVTYVKSSEKFSSFSLSDEGFLGVYGYYADPQYIREQKLKEENAVFKENYSATMKFDFSLKKGEEKVIYIVAGKAESGSHAAHYAESFFAKNLFEDIISHNRSEIQCYFERFNVKTPDKYLNSIVNLWLKRQISLGKTWGRIYGKGFRDLLQDITGFVSFDMARAKERLLYTLRYQFESGNGLRQFDPIVDYSMDSHGSSGIYQRERG
jgi:cellobiose phosphorylase